MARLAHIQQTMVSGFPLSGRQSLPASNVELERVKHCLLHEHSRIACERHVGHRIDPHAHAVVARTCATTYPVPVFPLLLHEETERVERKARIEREVYNRSPENFE